LSLGVPLAIERLPQIYHYLVSLACHFLLLTIHAHAMNWQFRCDIRTYDVQVLVTLGSMVN